MKKQLIILFLLTLLIFLTTFCKRECKQPPINKGIIVQSLKLNSQTTPDNGVIISDSAEFLNMFPDDAMTIDFNAYSLLGLYITGGGCDASITREVTSLDKEKQYHYKVTLYTCGYCKMGVYDFNWVIVPKLPSGWTVTFETENK
jgi:hypothetical protein